MVLEENDLSKLVVTKQCFKNLKCKNKTNKQTNKKQTSKQTKRQKTTATATAFKFKAKKTIQQCLQN